MSDDIKAIVERLTEAQRRALLSARETLFSDEIVIPLRNRHVANVAINLRAKGISEYSHGAQDRLTPLGLLVRDALNGGGE